MLVAARPWRCRARTTLRGRTDAAEACVLAAIREQVLTPDNVAYAVERTPAEIAKARAAADPVALRRELEAFMVERNAWSAG